MKLIDHTIMYFLFNKKINNNIYTEIKATQSWIFSSYDKKIIVYMSLDILEHFLVLTQLKVKTNFKK